MKASCGNSGDGDEAPADSLVARTMGLNKHETVDW